MAMSACFPAVIEPVLSEIPKHSAVASVRAFNACFSSKPSRTASAASNFKFRTEVVGWSEMIAWGMPNKTTSL